MTAPDQSPPGLGHRVFRALPYGIVVACGALLAYSIVNGEPFNVSLEDGVLEWGTVYFMLVCAAFAFAALVTDRATLTRPGRVFLVVMGVVLLLAVGEELSWGQRIFDWQAPEALQKESGGLIQVGHEDTTLHNLSFRSEHLKFSIGGLLFGVVLLIGLAVHGIWLPLTIRKDDPKARWLVDRLGVFVPPLELGALTFGAALVFYLFRRAEGTEAREFMEFIVPAMFSFMLVRSYFREPSRGARAAAVLSIVAVVWAIGSVVLATKLPSPPPAALPEAVPVETPAG